MWDEHHGAEPVGGSEGESHGLVDGGGRKMGVTKGLVHGKHEKQGIEGQLDGQQQGEGVPEGAADGGEQEQHSRRRRRRRRQRQRQRAAARRRALPTDSDEEEELADMPPLKERVASHNTEQAEFPLGTPALNIRYESYEDECSSSSESESDDDDDNNGEIIPKLTRRREQTKREEATAWFQHYGKWPGYWHQGLVRSTRALWVSSQSPESAKREWITQNVDS